MYGFWCPPMSQTVTFRFSSTKDGFVSYADECFGTYCLVYTDIVWIHRNEVEQIKSKLRPGGCGCNDQDDFLIMNN